MDFPKYKPLNKAKNQIRLLRIIPQSEHHLYGLETKPRERNLVGVTIEVVSLDDNPRYVALSYVWGGSHMPRMVVCVDGLPVYTTTNLEGALQALQHKTEPVFVWADALCINQADNLEKQHQVQLMTRIYESAMSVFVWLGYPLSRDEEMIDLDYEGMTDFATNRAMEFLNDLGSKASAFGILNLNIADVNNILSSNVREDLCAFKKDLENLAKETEYKVPWDDLDLLFSYVWFTRTWVAQEIAVPKNFAVVFLCGEKKLSLQHLLSSLCFIDFLTMHFAINVQTQDFTDPETGPYYTAMNKCDTSRPTRLIRARRMYQEEGGRKRRTLYQLLIDMHVNASSNTFLKASNPRDRVFALLGMSTNRLGLIPDYNSPCADAYTLAAAAILKEGHLDLLALNQSPEARTVANEDSKLPSWAPDWSSSIYRPCGGYLKDECYQASGQEKPLVDFRSLPNSSTAQMTTLQRCFDYIAKRAPLPPVLLIAGCTVDGISKVGTPWTPTSDDYKEWVFDPGRIAIYFSEIEEFCNESDRLDSDIYQNPRMRVEAPWRIPCANIRHHQNLRCRPSADGAELREGYDLIKANVFPEGDAQRHRTAERYRVAIGDMFKRRPFISKKGYVGLAPSYAEAGDLICILYGCIVPYILRRRTCGSGYELVGESYVHGIMDGEFVAKEHLTETYELY